MLKTRNAVAITVRTVRLTDRRPFAALRAAEASGRPLGADDFVALIERSIGRRLRPRKPARKPRARAEQMELAIGEMVMSP